MHGENFFPQTTLLKTKNKHKLIYLNYLEPKLEFEKTKESPFYFDESYKDKILIRGGYAKKILDKLFIGYNSSEISSFGILKISKKIFLEAQIIKLKNDDYLLISDDLSLAYKKLSRLARLKKIIIIFDVSRLYSLFSIYNLTDTTPLKSFNPYTTTYQQVKFIQILIETNRKEQLLTLFEQSSLFAIGLETRNTFLYNNNSIPTVNTLNPKKRRELLKIIYNLNQNQRIVRFEILGFIEYQKNKIYTITKQKVGRLINIYSSFDNKYPYAFGYIKSDCFDQYFFIKSHRDYIISKLIK